MTERKATRRPARKAKPKAGTELAVIPKTQLELDFERILAEMHAGFDRAENEVLASLDKINATIDFTELREDIDTQFDIIEQAGDATAMQAAEATPVDVLGAEVAFAKEQDALADVAEQLAQMTYHVRVLAYNAQVKLGALTSALS